MKYLLLDTECAACVKDWGKKCEFGYALADEPLRVLDTKQWLINPNRKFHRYTVTTKASAQKEKEEAHQAQARRVRRFRADYKNRVRKDIPCLQS